MKNPQHRNQCRGHQLCEVSEAGRIAMSFKSSIEWTNATWNPARGCTKISSGCKHCLDPSTPVLMADWSCRAIKDLKTGDTVVAFNEGSEGVGLNKVYEKAVVERLWWSNKPAVRIRTDDGGEIISSLDHRFLKPPRGWFKAGNSRVLQTRIRRIGTARILSAFGDDYCAGYIVGATEGDGTMCEGEEGRQYREKQWYWRIAVTSRQHEFIARLVQCAARFGIGLQERAFDSGKGTKMIKVETRQREMIRKLSTLWERSGLEYSKGFIAGIFDAEGSFGKSGGGRPTSLRIANTNAEILDAIVVHGRSAGFEFKIENFRGRHCRTARLYGSLDEIGRFLGEVRPAITYKKEAAFGCRIESRPPRVVAVEFLGDRDLVDIQTSKRTFVANGFLTHNCYAERFAERFRGVKGHPYEQGFDLRLVPEKLGEPLRWRTSKMIFVNSMSDLFHEDVPDAYIVAVARVMCSAKWHTFQVLTKRAARLHKLLRTKLRFAASQAHIWWGVSVENRKYGLPRIDQLRSAPAAVRFLSIEPLLEDLGEFNLRNINWVIVGGESGPGARPMEKEWVLSIRNQCRSFGVPFFFKQWGGVRKSLAGRKLDGKTYDELPERVPQPVLQASECLALAERVEAPFRTNGAINGHAPAIPCYSLA